MKQIIREACVESYEQCLRAASLGADRLELCARLDLGGTTPPLPLVKRVLDKVSIPVKVMIRSRGGDFVYTADEVAIMKASITDLLEIGVLEFVFGTLTAENEVDFSLLRDLCGAVNGCPVTFHKAIDMVPDQLSAIHAFAEIPNLKYVLTSGGAPSAKSGLEQLRRLVAEAPSGVTIISAGGVTNENLDNLHNAIGGKEYHGRRIVGELINP